MSLNNWINSLHRFTMSRSAYTASLHHFLRPASEKLMSPGYGSMSLHT